MILLCMYPFRFSVKLLHYILKNISDYSSRRTPAAKSTASAASITFLLKFFQFPSCFRCQICRNFNLYSCIFITVYRRIIHCNDTFASQTYLRSGLSTRFDVTENITVNGVNLCFTAKYCCCKWDIYSCVHISAFPFISGFILNVYFQKHGRRGRSRTSRRKRTRRRCRHRRHRHRRRQRKPQPTALKEHHGCNHIVNNPQRDIGRHLHTLRPVSGACSHEGRPGDRQAVKGLADGELHRCHSVHRLAGRRT